MEAKRKGRPPKQAPTTARYQVSLLKPALAKIAASPVEDVTAKEFVARNAELFHEVFAGDRSPQEVVRKLREELERDGIWRGTEAELEELIAKAHRECGAKPSTAGLSQSEQPLQDPDDKSGAETAGQIGKAGDDSTGPSSTTRQADASNAIDAARRTTGLPDPVKPHRAAVTSTGSIASTSAKAIAAPDASQSSARSADLIEAESKSDDPATNGDPVARDIPNEERGSDHLHDRSEAPLSEVPKDVAAQIVKGRGLFDPDDGYESFGSTDSG